MRNIIIIFLIKAFSSNGTMNKMWKQMGLLLLLSEKIVKPFVQCHVFAHSPPGRHPSNKYTVKTAQVYRFL